MVTSAGTGGQIGGAEDGVHFFAAHEAEDRSNGALARDREDTLAGDQEVGRLVADGEPSKRMDRGEPGVARADGVAAHFFQVLKEREDRVRREHVERQLVNTRARLLGEKPEQQTERVPIRRDGVRAQVALGAQRAKELLSEKGEGGRHGSELGFVPALPVVLK